MAALYTCTYICDTGRTRAMVHKPLTPDTISAAPKKKGNSKYSLSAGCACSLAAVYMAMSATDCKQSVLAQLIYTITPDTNAANERRKGSRCHILAVLICNNPAAFLRLLRYQMRYSRNSPGGRSQKSHVACALPHRC